MQTVADDQGRSIIASLGHLSSAGSIERESNRLLTFFKLPDLAFIVTVVIVSSNVQIGTGSGLSLYLFSCGLHILYSFLLYLTKLIFRIKI